MDDNIVEKNLELIKREETLNLLEKQLKDWENNNWKYRDEIDMDVDSLVDIAKSYYTNISLTKSKLKDLGINIEWNSLTTFYKKRLVL